MNNQEAFTINSLKKGFFLCLKITLILGVFFAVIFGQRTVEGFLWSLLISAMYSYGLGFGNGFINTYLSQKWSWITQTNQRVWAGVIATILYTIPVVLGIDYVVFIVLNGVDPSDFFKGQFFWAHLFYIILSLGVSAFLHARGFMIKWKAAMMQESTKQDISLLQKGKGQVVKLSEEVDDLRDNIFFFIKNLEESSVEASGFYINILGYLQDISQSLEYISKVIYKHVNNNHKKLKTSQNHELEEIYTKLNHLFIDTQKAFKSGSFEEIGVIISEKREVYDLVKTKIKAQVKRTRTEESSPKNTTLYFSILLETKDLMNAIMNLLEEYHSSHDSSIEPATIPSIEPPKEDQTMVP